MHQEVKFDYIAELTGTRDQFEYLNESRHSIYATTDKPVYNVCNPTLNVKFTVMRQILLPYVSRVSQMFITWFI